MPEITAEQLDSLFIEPIPRSPKNVSSLLGDVVTRVFPNSRQNGAPGFFGYVASPGTPLTALGDLAISALNTNVTGWRSAPAGTTIEQTVINWIRDLLGMPMQAGGLFVSGGSMANFSGLAAARSAVFPQAAEAGLSPESNPRIYATEEVHLSIPKAASMLGLGTKSMRYVRHDGRMRMDIAALERAIREDRDQGFTPLCIVGSAGTAATGAVDDLRAIAAVAREHGIWFHVDASYGGFAILAPSVCEKLSGIEDADSISLDPHKWLYLPLDCGCILYRDPATAVRAFSYHADYTRPLGFDNAEAFGFWDYGPELSRRFRALNVWLQIKAAGIDAISEAVESNVQCARYLEQCVANSADFEMLCPVELSIFCFRYSPAGYSGDLNQLNAAILQQLQRSGRSYLSNASINGQFALRGCVLNWRTTTADIDRLLSAIRYTANSC